MGDRSRSDDVIFKCGDKTVIEVAVKNELGAFKVAQVQRELNKSVVSLCSSSAYTTCFVYARLFGVNETVVLHAGNYDGKFKLVPPGQLHTLSVPPGMTLLIPSSANVEIALREDYLR